MKRFRERFQYIEREWRRVREMWGRVRVGKGIGKGWRDGEAKPPLAFGNDSLFATEFPPPPREIQIVKSSRGS